MVLGHCGCHSLRSLPSLSYNDKFVAWLSCLNIMLPFISFLSIVLPLFEDIAGRNKMAPGLFLCLCLWRGEGGSKGWMDGVREHLTSEVRGGPSMATGAMTCLITFAFDWVQCALKVARRKWDFPLPKYYPASLFQAIRQGSVQFTALPVYRSHQAPAASPLPHTVLIWPK